MLCGLLTLCLGSIYWGLWINCLGEASPFIHGVLAVLLLGLVVWKQFSQCPGCSGVYNRRWVDSNISVPLIALFGRSRVKLFIFFLGSLWWP